MTANRIILNVIISSIMGISLCLIIKVAASVQNFETHTVFIAELDENIFPGERITVESLVSDMPNVKKSSVELITAKEAMASMKQEMPELAYLADNPFRDVITFTTKGVPKEKFEEFKHELTDIRGINEVFYDEELIQTLTQSSKNARMGLLVLSIVILIGSLFALGLKVKRDVRPFLNEIKIMTMAGSEDDEIINYRRQWSAKWGAISACLAALIIALNIIFINNTLLDGLEITFLQSIISIICMFALVVITHVLFSHHTIKTYLAQINPSIKS